MGGAGWGDKEAKQRKGQSAAARQTTLMVTKFSMEESSWGPCRHVLPLTPAVSEAEGGRKSEASAINQDCLPPNPSQGQSSQGQRGKGAFLLLCVEKPCEFERLRRASIERVGFSSQGDSTDGDTTPSPPSEYNAVWRQASCPLTPGVL